MKNIKIGVIGFSQQSFDTQLARRLFMQSIGAIIAEKSPKDFIIVSGLTNCGIPKIAYEIADEWGIETIGFSAQEALKQVSGIYKVHQQIIIGDVFGDESANFIDFIDYLIRIGGGKQSHQEVRMFKQRFAEAEHEKYLVEFEV